MSGIWPSTSESEGGVIIFANIEKFIDLQIPNFRM